MASPSQPLIDHPTLNLYDIASELRPEGSRHKELKDAAAIEPLTERTGCRRDHFAARICKPGLRALIGSSFKNLSKSAPKSAIVW